ncbi:hypothetical protein X976_5702 [Burkholderia pseudomallei MSHR7500]|nr:hypothetical protein X976_5702 [Burkholderia pseudomallei MSHR7500]
MDKKNRKLKRTYSERRGAKVTTFSVRKVPF